MNAGQDNTMIAIHESALSKIGDVLITLQDETIKRMSDALEAAEARIEELKTQLESITTVDLHNAMQRRDELLQEARDSATLIMELRQERDEARRQLTEAQRAIDVLSNTVVAQDATIKRLSQKREDVADYRAEIARLTRQAENTPKHIQEALNEGDGVYRP